MSKHPTKESRAVLAFYSALNGQPKSAAAPKQTARNNRLDKSRLPSAFNYLDGLNIKLRGGGEWRTGLCPFHEDKSPSLSVNVISGAFKCFACGASGGDLIAFEMRLKGIDFKTAAKSLGAWEGE